MKTQMVNFSIPKDLLDKLDAVAEKDAKNRSEALRDAVRAYVARKTAWEDIFAQGKERGSRLTYTEDDVEQLVDEVRQGT